ncbi:hypothetical protein TREES_T100007940, partial [Tupaia chinensis]
IKIRSGKIYVNDLPMILCTLKTSVSDSEMRQALKTIDIDAFQDALKIFCRIKDGRVEIDEVIAVLDSMNIPISSETFQEVIKHTYVDDNHMVDIGDIVFTLNELLQQYEDVSIMEGSALDDTSDRKLSNVAEGYLQYRKKSSLSPRLPESSVSKRLNKKNLQHLHSKIKEESDDLELKRPKSTLQIRKFLDGIDSSDVGFQEPNSKNELNFRKHLEKDEIHESKSKPQSFKSITNLSKSLDKSDISTISELKKPAVRRHSSILQQVSSKEKTAVTALENACEAISKLQENYIVAEELQSLLPSVGISLSDKEFQKIVKDTTKNENGMVKLDDFISALYKERSLPEYNVLTDVINAVDKIKDENVDSEHLNTCLQNFGIYLSKPEFEKLTELTEADEIKKVNFKELVDTMMTNTERFSEKLLLSDAVENFHNLSKEKMDVSDLWNTLSGMNSNLKKDEFVAALKLATVDEGGKVQFEEFAKVVKNVHDASRFEDLQGVVSALDLLEGDMIPGEKLEDFLKHIGIQAPKEEAEKILQSDFVSEDNMVNVKDCMKTLRDTKKFSNFIDFRKEALSSNLKLPKVNDNMEVDLKDLLMEMKESPHFKKSVENGKVTIQEFMTKFSDTLITPKAAGEFYIICIYRP